MNADAATEFLGIYLNDHWAGAAAGRALAHRVAKENSDRSWGPDLVWLAEQIDEDRQTLNMLREHLGVGGGRLKQVGALLAERVGRIKPNGRIIRHSPLSRVLETEALMAGILAKQRLWAAMRHGGPSRAELAVFDFVELERRADAQLTRLRLIHEQASSLAFSGTDEPNP